MASNDHQARDLEPVLKKRKLELLRRFAPDIAHKFESADEMATELAKALNDPSFTRSDA